MTPKEYVLLYLKVLKWSVVPVVPKSKRKKPYVKWAPYQNRLPTVEEIEDWWRKWPDANVGIITGKLSGILCVDIDSPKAQQFYISEYGEIHNTARQTTGKPGGMHLIFNYPTDGKLYPNVGDPTREKNEDSIEIDIRGEGGFFVACPSIHMNGTQYSWVLDPTEDPDNVMDLPEAVKNLWGYIKKGTKPKPWGKDDSSKKTGKPPFDHALYLEGADEPGHPGAGEGGRIIGRDVACTRLVGHFLHLFNNDDVQTRKVLYGWGRLCNPVFTEEEVDEKVNSILKKKGRSDLGEALGGTLISKIDILMSPDGTAKYNVSFEGFEGYSELEPADLTNQLRFITKYMVITRILLVPKPKEKWAALVTNALKEANVILVDAEETNIGLIVEKLKADCQKDRICTDISLVDHHIISLNGSAYFSFKYLFSSLQAVNNKISNNQLSSLLRRMGCVKIKKRLDNGEEKRFWEFKFNENPATHETD